MVIVVIDDASVCADDIAAVSVVANGIDVVDAYAFVDVSFNGSNTVIVVTSASIDVSVMVNELEIVDENDSVDSVVALDGVEGVVVVVCVLKDDVDVIVCVAKDDVDAISVVMILFSNVPGVRTAKRNIKTRATAIKAKTMIAMPIMIHR